MPQEQGKIVTATTNTECASTEAGINKKAQLTSLQLACDMFVACYMEKYKEEEPQIGKIVAMHETSQNIDVEWMTGAYDDR